MVIKVSFVVELIVKKIFSFVLMAQLLDLISMSVLRNCIIVTLEKFASIMTGDIVVIW